MSWSPQDLRTVGYFAKRPALRPDGFDAPGVEFVCSACDCSCLTASPPDWIAHWAHNDLFLFDTLAAVDKVVPASASAQFLRYGLRSLPVLFDADGERSFDLGIVQPEPIPPSFVRLGYDVCARWAGSTLEHSPLSCNSMAAECRANRWCLLDGFDDAVAVATRFSRGQVEPGPYLLLEVWASMLPTQLPMGGRDGAARR